MTIERKLTISVDDIMAFEVICANCLSTLSIPLDKCNRTASQCPRCGEGWYMQGAAENEAITGLASAISEIMAQLRAKRAKFRFRLEISADAFPVSHVPDV